MLAIHRLLNRWLGRLPSGCYASIGDGEPLDLPTFSGETLLGIYRNPTPYLEQDIVFTDRALHYQTDAQWTRVAYVDIVSYEAPSGKVGAQSLTLLSGLGKHTLVLAGVGSGERAQDAFAVLNVIRKLVIAKEAGLLERLIAPMKPDRA